MDLSPREELYLRLPVVAARALLYDYDVVLTEGRFLTVHQAWHGPRSVEFLKCLPGALPLHELGGAFGTNLTEVVLGVDGPPLLLCGAFTDSIQPALLRSPDVPVTQDVLELFPGYGRFRLLEAVIGDVAAGDVLVLEDGYAYRLTEGGGLVRLDMTTWQPVADADSSTLVEYLAARDLRDLPLVRLVP